MVYEDLPPIEEEAGAEVASEENAESVEQTDEPPSLEDIASGMGWSPQEKWRGDPDKWKPAHEFVQSTADINRNLTQRLADVDGRLEAISRTSAQVTERALAQERQKLLQEREAAFDEGDKEKFNEIDKAIGELSTVAPTQAAPPEAQSFVEKHSSWFGVDQEATNWAQTRSGQLAEQGLSPARQLATIESELGNYFPEHAPKQEAKPKPAPLSQPGRRGGAKPKGKTFADLPPEAKHAAEDFAKRGRLTKDDYAKIYFEEQEA